MYLLGNFVGTFIPVIILSLLSTWLASKLTSEVLALIAGAVVAAVLTVILTGFGNADGGQWDPRGSIVTAPIAAAIIFAFRYWRFQKSRMQS